MLEGNMCYDKKIKWEDNSGVLLGVEDKILNVCHGRYKIVEKVICKVNVTRS